MQTSSQSISSNVFIYINIVLLLFVHKQNNTCYKKISEDKKKLARLILTLNYLKQVYKQQTRKLLITINK